MPTTARISDYQLAKRVDVGIDPYEERTLRLFVISVGAQTL